MVACAWEKGGYYGVLDFYADHGYDDSAYDDCFREIIPEVPAERDQRCIRLQDFPVHEKQGYLGVRPQILWEAVVSVWGGDAAAVGGYNAPCHRK